MRLNRVELEGHGSFLSSKSFSETLLKNGCSIDEFKQVYSAAIAQKSSGECRQSRKRPRMVVLVDPDPSSVPILVPSGLGKGHMVRSMVSKSSQYTP